MTGDLTTATLQAALTPLEAPDRVDVVAYRLSTAIRLGLLADGQRLPSETDFAAHLGVSTVTLRTALARLRQTGLVKTRRGRDGGTVVCAPANRAGERLREQLSQFTVYELRELGDHRSAVAGMSAYLAAQRVVEAEIDQLRQEITRLTAATTTAERWAADVNFHVALAAGTQSSRLARSEIALQAELGDLLWLLAEHDPHTNGFVADHRRVYLAVRSRRASAARDAMTRHLADETAALIRARMSIQDA